MCFHLDHRHGGSSWKWDLDGLRPCILLGFQREVAVVGEEDKAVPMSILGLLPHHFKISAIHRHIRSKGIQEKTARGPRSSTGKFSQETGHLALHPRPPV